MLNNNEVKWQTAFENHSTVLTQPQLTRSEPKGLREGNQLSFSALNYTREIIGFCLLSPEKYQSRGLAKSHSMLALQ